MSKYAQVHAEANGPGDARPTALQIVKDANQDLSGKVAVVTGSSSGIGVETVRALATTGLSLILPARNPDKIKAALGDSFDPEKMEIVFMDQTSLESVREAAKAILEKTEKVNILINNAGIMLVPNLQLSKDGYELQLATNHLAHFLLFQLLKPALLASSTPELRSRVVCVSSDVHRNFTLNEPGNYNFEKGGYHGHLAYVQSKTANICMANEIDRRYGSRGMHATSIHPGVSATGLGRYLTDEQIEGLRQNELLAKLWKSPEQGAATTVWGAIGREWEGRGGRHLAECADTSVEDCPDYSGVDVVKPYDAEKAAQLWKDSLVMVNVPDDE